MSIDAIKLARECGALVGVKHATDCDGEMIIFAPEELTRFYTLAQAQALRDASKEMHKQMNLNAALTLAIMAEELEKK